MKFTNLIMTDNIFEDKGDLGLSVELFLNFNSI